MAFFLKKTGERMTPDLDNSTEYQTRVCRHLFAYKFVEQYIDNKTAVLEAGCGEGYGTNILADKAKSIVGLDIDQDTIANASRKYKKNNCSFSAYDGNKFPFADHSFDLVVSFQVLEHIKNDRAYLAEIARVLKDKGRLILTTPNKTNRLAPGQKPWNRFHVREYDNTELGNLLSHYFRTINIYGVQGNPEIQQKELARVKRLSKLAKMDPFKIRKILPASLLELISSKYTNSGVKKDTQYTVDDFFVKAANPATALDWLSVCSK